MNRDQRRAIYVRAFMATGKDGEESLVWYVDQLERAVLSAEAIIAARKNRRPRDRIDLALKSLSQFWDRRQRG